MITQERLKEVLHYDPKTGIWTWIKKPHPVANTIKIGQRAGTLNDGYWIIKIDKKPYKAHRLAFLYMIGRFPKEDVDHKCYDRQNNIWTNLREATRSQNQYNKVQKNNTSGYKGVSWDKQQKKWMAYIKENRNRIFLGRFDSKDNAAKAYNEAALKYHGEYALLNEIISDEI